MTASSQLPEGPKTPSHQHPSKIIFASQTLKVGFEMAANLIVAASAEMELVWIETYHRTYPLVG